MAAVTQTSVRDAENVAEEEGAEVAAEAGFAADEDDTEGEEGCEDDADRGVFGDAAAAGEEGDAEGGERAEGKGAEEDALAGHIAEDDAGEDGMRKRVADKGEAAEDNEAADEAAEHADEDDFEQSALHKRVAEGFGEPVHQANTATCPPKAAFRLAGV